MKKENLMNFFRKRKLFSLAAVVLFALGGGGGCKKAGEASAGKTLTIVVDGGGDFVDYNSTASMEKSDANPYPYNELEKLAKEYSDAHPGVVV
jgi:ABC-type glycerol-3-phosphate transport system substrate-binding protein